MLTYAIVITLLFGNLQGCVFTLWFMYRHFDAMDKKEAAAMEASNAEMPQQGPILHPSQR